MNQLLLNKGPLGGIAASVLLAAFGFGLIFCVDWNDWTWARLAGNGVGLLVLLAALICLCRTLAKPVALVTSHPFSDDFTSSSTGLAYALPSTVLKVTLVYQAQAEVRPVEDKRTAPLTLRAVFAAQELKVETLVVPDSRRMFLLKPVDNRWWTLSELKVNVNEAGFLQNVNGALQDDRLEMVGKWLETASTMLRPGPVGTPGAGARGLAAAVSPTEGGPIKYADLKGVTASVVKFYRLAESKGILVLKDPETGGDTNEVKLSEGEEHSILKEITQKARTAAAGAAPGYEEAEMGKALKLQVELKPEEAVKAQAAMDAEQIARKIKNTTSGTGAQLAFGGVVYVVPGGARLMVCLDEVTLPFLAARVVLPECGRLARIELNALPFAKTTLGVQFEAASGRALSLTGGVTPQQPDKIQAAFKALMKQVDDANKATATEEDTAAKNAVTAANKAAEVRVKLAVYRNQLLTTEAQITSLASNPAPDGKIKLALEERRKLAEWLKAVIAELEKGNNGEFGQPPAPTTPMP